MGTFISILISIFSLVTFVALAYFVDKVKKWYDEFVFEKELFLLEKDIHNSTVSKKNYDRLRTAFKIKCNSDQQELSNNLWNDVFTVKFKKYAKNDKIDQDSIYRTRIESLIKAKSEELAKVQSDESLGQGRRKELKLKLELEEKLSGELDLLNSLL